MSVFGGDVLCLRKWKKEIKCVCVWSRRASIVGDMIACLDLSYGKNKTSISHYLPFNQIPTFLPSCHKTVTGWK